MSKRKVLISFLGTGSLINRNDMHRNNRNYRTAKYRLDDKEYVSSFVADALTDHYGIDTLIIIGTVKSMWEELYTKFCYKRGIQPDEDFYTELGTVCESANVSSGLKLPGKEKIEEVLGQGSRIVLINYGINEEELNKNISSILGIESDLKDGDELYVDITHSFRSLPLLLMNTLIHLQNISSKNVSIERILYGMLDISGELGYAPVINLSKVLEVNNWISGAYSFSEFGNAYKISKLLEEIDKNASNRLRDFSDVKNLSHLYALKNSVSQLSGINLDELPAIARMTVTPVVRSFIREVKPDGSTSEFQYKLAKWYRDKHNYSAAYLTLVESIVTYVCEKCRFDGSIKDDRDMAKIQILKNPDFAKLKKVYVPLNRIRNCMAHALPTVENSKNLVKLLNQSIEDLKELLH